MKAIYKVSDRLSFEIDATNQVELFEKLSEIDTVFSNLVCPVTHDGPSDDVIFVTRKTKKGNYSEIQCRKPPYNKLSISRHEATPTMYPKRKDKDGKEIGTRGWHTWSPDKQDK